MRSHNLHEGPGHGFSCTLQDPSAKVKLQAHVVSDGRSKLCCDSSPFSFFCTYSSREDVMGTAVQKVTFADTLICELHPLSRLISCNNPNQCSVRKTLHISSRVEVSAALKNITENAFISWCKKLQRILFHYKVMAYMTLHISLVCIENL